MEAASADDFHTLSRRSHCQTSRFANKTSNSHHNGIIRKREVVIENHIYQMNVNKLHVLKHNVKQLLTRFDNTNLLQLRQRTMRRHGKRVECLL